MQRLVCSFLFLLTMGALCAQDTFSIVAVDSITGEVGSAGASCISRDNLNSFLPDKDPDFLGDLIPGKGAINTQSYYNETNQNNARSRMLAGRSPQQIVTFLQANDAENNPAIRQYGIAAFHQGVNKAAAYTGANCLNQKGHRVGSYYSIQGNILIGTKVLDSMETRFLNATGTLADRLMAALQGANIPGADSRCLNNGSSALFAFIKVAKPGDSTDNPYLRLYVSLNEDEGEPIDSLQALYDAWKLTHAPEPSAFPGQVFVYPQPASGPFQVSWVGPQTEVRMQVRDMLGRLMMEMPIQNGLQTVEPPSNWPAGFYLLGFTDKQGNPVAATRKLFWNGG